MPRKKQPADVWIDGELIKIKPVNSEEIFFTDYTPELYQKINGIRWYVCGGRARGCANGKDKHLHHLILPLRKGVWVDHINRDPKNNTRANLRYLTYSQSGINRKTHALNASGHTGVCWHKSTGKWRARIRVNKKRMELGEYDFIEGAIRAYQRAEEKYYPGIRYKDTQCS